jgi:hypothetical protein
MSLTTRCDYCGGPLEKHGHATLRLGTFGYHTDGRLVDGDWERDLCAGARGDDSCLETVLRLVDEALDAHRADLGLEWQLVARDTALAHRPPPPSDRGRTIEADVDEAVNARMALMERSREPGGAGELNLDHAAWAALVFHGRLTTVEAIEEALAADRLAAIPHIGPKRLQQIREALDRHHAAIREET